MSGMNNEQSMTSNMQMAQNLQLLQDSCSHCYKHKVTVFRNVMPSSLVERHKYFGGKMPSSGMLRRVALVRTDVFEELSTSIIRVTRIGDFVFLCSMSVASYG
jgi:hypothetical protein